jgi:hypothetical protein
MRFLARYYAPILFWAALIALWSIVLLLDGGAW